MDDGIRISVQEYEDLIAIRERVEILKRYMEVNRIFLKENFEIIFGGDKKNEIEEGEGIEAGND